MLHIGGGAGVEVWTKDGTRLGSWGETGQRAGPVRAGQHPRRLAGREGSIYTAEAGFNNRLQKFARV